MFAVPQTPMEVMQMEGTLVEAEAPLAEGYMVCPPLQTMAMGTMLPNEANQDLGMAHCQQQQTGGLSAPESGSSTGATHAGHSCGDQAASAPRKEEATFAGKGSAASSGTGKDVKKTNLSPWHEALLAPLASEAGRRAARALGRRVEEARRFKANRSTFSALNIDVVRRDPASHPAKSQPLAAVTVPAEKEVSRAGQGKQKCKGLVKPLNRQFSILSQDTALHDSDGKESETSSPYAADEWEELRAEASAESKPSFAEVRNYLLGFRVLPAGPPPPEVAALGTAPVTPRDGKALPRSPALATATPRRATEGSPHTLLAAKAAKAGRARTLSQVEELKRTVQSLLNKVCPENVGTVVEKIAGVEVRDLEQLETIIELIFKKALAEPHYCETYADMVFGLKASFPEFPSPDSGQPITFKSSVLNICQNEFEELLTVIKPLGDDDVQCNTEELELKRACVAGRMRANMKFIGHLFLRRLLSAKVIGSVLCELVLCAFADLLPEESAIECACELLVAVGYTLESMPAGEHAVQQVCGRLLELKTRKTVEGKAAYCKRVQFMVQDVLDARAAGWARRLFKSSAKTKEEIRLEQERDLVAARSRGSTAAGPEEVVAGLRPQYLDESMPVS
mmetsp:Transcript_9027/g.25268  ORF Transcript_9027/g.25268 Transcript_9027/m.25268 type:complete len:624 (-) Transcript_9027:51-1922(-)